MFQESDLEEKASSESRHKKDWMEGSDGRETGMGGAGVGKKDETDKNRYCREPSRRSSRHGAIRKSTDTARKRERRIGWRRCAFS